MSYIVKGHDMPKCCNECPLVYYNDYNGFFYCLLTDEVTPCTRNREDYDSGTLRLNSCPLEPISDNILAPTERKTSMTNLKDETTKILKENGKTVEDIRWIGSSYGYKIDPDEFWKLADNLYNDGYTPTEVATNLIIVGSDWWLERNEFYNHGAEWWEFKCVPVEPSETRKVGRVMSNVFTDCALDEMNQE